MSLVAPILFPLALAAEVVPEATALAPEILSRSASWTFGWALVLAGFASGALLGLGFHRAGFLGGYGSLRRRLARLGHVALVALGVLNALYALGPESAVPAAAWAGPLLAAGGVLMPAVCFLVAWRPALRPLFALPVVTLMAAVALVLYGGVP